MSVLLVTGPVVRLHERFTVTFGWRGLTLATTKSGPIVKSGCGCEARKTWLWPGIGIATAAQRKAAMAGHDVIMSRSSAKVRLHRRPDRDWEQLAHFFPPRTRSPESHHECHAGRRQRDAAR